MKHQYNIDGMTCGNCVSKVKDELLKRGDITEANIQLSSPQATIMMQKHISLPELQRSLSKAGNFKIAEVPDNFDNTSKETDKTTWFETYKPLFVIAVYITGITVLFELFNTSFDLERSMQNFMAGFFLTFSFFKMLDLKGFAESYSTYDIIAKKWVKWGYVYAFFELALGIAFLIKINPLITNIVTVLVMSISLIGVLQSVLNKKKIKCACLGTVFNLPMSTVTIVEDGLMIVMSVVMILSINWF